MFLRTIARQVFLFLFNAPELESLRTPNQFDSTTPLVGATTLAADGDDDALAELHPPSKLGGKKSRKRKSRKRKSRKRKSRKRKSRKRKSRKRKSRKSKITR